MKYSMLTSFAALLTSFSCTALAAPQSTPSDFEPTYVANQEKISVQMIAAEAEQFAYLGQLLATQLDSPQKQRDLDAAETEVRRAELLYTTNSISLEELQSRKAQRDLARIAIEVSSAKSQVARSMAEVAKYKILDEAQSSMEVLRSAANAQVLCLEAQRFLTIKSLEQAQSFLVFTSIREATAKELLKSGAITEQEYAQRLLQMQSAKTGVSVTKLQLETMTTAVAAAKRTLARVSRS
jgi:hypothetical protein